MQDKKWVRLGLTLAIVGGSLGAVSAVGCSGDDNNGGGGKDSGADHTSSGADSSSSSGGDSSSSSGGDTGVKDSPSGGDGEGGTTVPNAKVYLVHGAVDQNAPPFRFCFGLDNSAAHDGSNVSVAGGIPPFPDYQVSPQVPIAGLPAGFGGSTASSPTLKSFDLSTITVALYALNAVKVANDTVDGGPDGGAELPCEKVIGADAKGTTGTTGYLTPGTDYWYLGTIVKGTLTHGTTWAAVVGGCLPGETGAAAALCGSGYDPAKGNLKLMPYQLDNTTVIAADAGIGAQFALASSQWDGVVGSLGGAATVAGFLVPNPAAAGDGGAADAAPPPPFIPAPIATAAKDDGKLYPAALAPVSGVTFDTKTAFFAQGIAADGGTFFVPPTCNPALGNCAGVLPMANIAQLSGTTFANGQGYAFILLGDPNQPPFLDDAGTVFNGKFPHFLAFPTSNP
jgi:hypothetical protein